MEIIDRISRRFTTENQPGSRSNNFEFTTLEYEDIKLVGHRFCCPNCPSVSIRKVRSQRVFFCDNCKGKFEIPLDRTKPREV